MARNKQFKAESKKLLDMMINSIYTHKEIFLRELISNASDAMDKLYFLSLTNSDVKLDRDDFKIKITLDKENRTVTISDNGIGMNQSELEENLGTIAHSGSFNFKNENEKQDDIDIIGQFGVGFYSAFMVAKKVTVETLKFGEGQAYLWESEGTSGYTVTPCSRTDVGTTITLQLKDNTEEENYDKFLQQYEISSIVKKYSDFIRYPITMDFSGKRLKADSDTEYEDYTEERTLNSMVPLWKKDKKDITKQQYTQFYKDQFNDYNEPLKEVHYKVEGTATYSALLYIPKKAPFGYYNKDFEKGLQLYSSGVLIMDKCADLLPDHFSFVKGLVDSEDLSLNISREMLQHDRQLKVIAANIEKKIKTELLKLQKDDREGYEEFFEAFGMGIKFGIYNSFGANKETLQDLLMFVSSHEKKMATLAEYIDRTPEMQDKIYYACGETADKIDMMPQVETAKKHGYEVFYLTDGIGEFVFQMMGDYKGKKFINVSGADFDISTESEKAELAKLNEDSKEMLEEMKNTLGEKVHSVRFTSRLSSHPVCLSSEGGLSVEMEKVLNSMPSTSGVKAQLVLEINKDHPIAGKLSNLYENDKATLAKYTQVLYASARLIEGLAVENPTELSGILCDMMLGI